MYSFAGCLRPLPLSSGIAARVEAEPQGPSGARVLPRDYVQMGVVLTARVEMEEGLRFALREGGEPWGRASSTKVIK